MSHPPSSVRQVKKRGRKPSGWPPGNRPARGRCPRRKTRPDQGKTEKGKDMYNNHPLKLPANPDIHFTFDYVPFGETSELVGTCTTCGNRQRSGLMLGEEVPEKAIARVKDRMRRYHRCPTTRFTAMAEASEITTVMAAFGFPEWLMPDLSQCERESEMRGDDHE